MMRYFRIRIQALLVLAAIAMSACVNGNPHVASPQSGKSTIIVTCGLLGSESFTATQGPSAQPAASTSCSPLSGENAKMDVPAPATYDVRVQGSACFADNTILETVTFSQPGQGHTVHYSCLAGGLSASTPAASVGATPAPPGMNTIWRELNRRTGEHFYTLTEGEGAAVGFVVEGIGFLLYAQQTDGNMRTLYRCFAPGSTHFVSVDPNCEGQRFEGALGFAHVLQQGTDMPLYRFRLPSNNDHLITFSSTAEGARGYIFEGVLGYAQP